jgi:hypothetical protein
VFASRPEIMGRVLGIVYRCIASHLIKNAGFSRRTVQAGAVTLIQRFGGARNLNVHFHMLFLDGVYVERSDGGLRFHRVKAPSSAELARLTRALAVRIGRLLERQGLSERDGDVCMDAGGRATQGAVAENSYLAGDVLQAGPMEQRLGSSITCRIGIGPQQGRKLFTLQTLPAYEERLNAGVGKVAGFSLHAGVATAAHEREKLERLQPHCATRRLGTVAFNRGDHAGRASAGRRDRWGGSPLWQASRFGRAWEWRAAHHAGVVDIASAAASISASRRQGGARLAGTGACARPVGRCETRRERWRSLRTGYLALMPLFASW